MKYIEYYDTDEIELYDLNADPSETTNIAAKHPEFCPLMKRNAAEFRILFAVQKNTPNPDYNQAAADKIYKEFDTSKIPLRATAAETAAEFKVWRERMNAAVAGQKRSAKAKAE